MMILYLALLYNNAAVFNSIEPCIFLKITEKSTSIFFEVLFKVYSEYLFSGYGNSKLPRRVSDSYSARIIPFYCKIGTIYLL